MQHSVIEGTDFGVDTANLKKMDLFEVPVEMVEARPDRAVAPAVKVNMDEVKDTGQAADAAKTEVLNLGVVVNFDGEAFTIPKPEDWDIEIWEAQEEDRIVTVLKLLLGDSQWNLFKSKKRKLTDLTGLFLEVQKVLGFQAGE
jgi:hypothetical protein